MCSRPRWRRKRAAPAQSGCQSPMSEAKRPVKISRTKLAPVTAPIATLASRVPEIIDAERRLEMRFGGLHDGRHRRDALGRRLEDIGAIVLVAEHHGVDAARLQALDVGNRALDQLVEPAVGVVKRRAGQGPDVNHGDHDFFRIAKEVEHHGLFPQAHAV